ncbi:MAG: helix-turn-helix domain-containing protein, partial [Niveispirillum sp.]|nr:helix-turn-helix domain-containing protein [Niveispirillum sp.]
VPDRAAAGAALRSLGIEVEWRQAPVAVDVKAIRERLGLTQASFAARFGLELDSVRNWEQGRYSPDPIARTLLKVIEQSPEAVDKAVAA